MADGASRGQARLALRTRAVLSSRPRDVASHQSALALHGLPLHGVPLGTVDAMADVSRVRVRSRLRTHVRDRTLPVVSADGCPCVAVELALAQVLVRHGLLAALVPLDAALHARRVSVAGVAAVLEGMPLTARLRRRVASSSRWVIRRASRWGRPGPGWPSSTSASTCGRR